MIATLTMGAVVMAATCATTPDFGAPGPYHAGRMDVSVPRPDGGSFTATLFYPATSPGLNTPYDPAGAPYPGISFGHGFVQPVSQYRSTLEHLATWGCLVIAAQSFGGLLPDHAAFAADLSHCLTWLEARNDDDASMLFQQVDTDRFGLSGHSMGGGASILAAANDTRVEALANLAAAETNPSAIAAMTAIRIPVRLISGGDDAIVPPATNGAVMYATGAPPRQHQVIEGGFHCGFVEQGSLFCDSGGIPRAEQLAITRRLLMEFFALYLRGDQESWRIVWGPDLDADPRVETARDAGIVVAPTTSNVEGPSCDVVVVPLTLENTGDAPDAFALLAEGEAWDVTVVPAQSPMLEPGASCALEARIAVTGAGPGEQTILVSARSGRDGGTRGYAVVTAHRRGGPDVDGSGSVDFPDLLAVLAAWGASGGPEDIDGDGTVGFPDVLAVLAAWGPCR